MNISENHFLNDKCPTNQLFELLGKKWIVFVLMAIGQGTGSFSAISRKLSNINPKTLSERLDTLIEKGYLERMVTQQKPLKINYSLTKRGEELHMKLGELGEWVKSNA